MSILKDLAQHIVHGFEAIETKIIGVEKRAVDAVEARFEAFKAELLADFGAGDSEAVAAVGAKVAGMTDAPPTAPADSEPAMPPVSATPVEPVTVHDTTTGAPIVIDPTAGTTTHTDPTSGTVTTLSHTDGSASATATSGMTVTPDPAAVSAAVEATKAQGVPVAGA